MVGEGASFSPTIFTKITFYSFPIFIDLFIHFLRHAGTMLS